MNKLIKIGIAFLLITFVYSCSKNSPPPQSTLLQPYLIDGTWQLVSATDNSLTGRISTYKGTAADSILFLYGADRYSNVVLTNINTSSKEFTPSVVTN